MFKTITKLGAALLLTAGLASVQAQTYLPNVTFGGVGNSANQFSQPYGMAIAPDGRIFVTDQGNNRISVWTQSGNTFGNLTTFGTNGSGANQFSLPSGISIAPDGKIFVTDLFNHRISVWTQSGNSFGNLTTFGTNGSAANQFNFPYDITIASNGEIFVADANNDRISVWTQSGNTFGNLTTFGTSGNGANQFNRTRSINIDTDGKIYVADISNHRISVWTQSGTSFGNLTTFGTSGNGANQFSFPVAIRKAVDGKIFVADNNNNRISVWTQSGNTFGNLTTFGTNGSAVNQFSFPSGVSVASDGKIFIADRSNHRISIWSVPTRPFVTEWDLSQFGENPNAIKFEPVTTGNVSYQWETIPAGSSGSGTFNTNPAVLTGMPANARISLSIDGTNFKSFRVHFRDAERLANVAQWGTVNWTSFENAFQMCPFLQISATDVPNLSAVTSMQSMFIRCPNLTTPANIGTWNTSNVTKMGGMFSGAEAFNQPIGNWNVSNVTDMEYMFKNAYAFSQSVSGWNVSNVTKMNNMFEGSGFDQNLGAWGTKLNANVDLTDMLSFSNISLTNYDATLQGFSATNVTGRTLGAANLYYCAGESARNLLTSATGVGGKGWTITDAGSGKVGITTQPMSLTKNKGENANNIYLSVFGLNPNTLWSNGETTNELTTQLPGTYQATISGACGMPVVSNEATLKYYLNIEVDNLSKTYGDANPTLTGVVTGMLDDYAVTSMYTTTVTSLTGIGTYAIEATATGANMIHYQLQATNAELTITAANLTVSANNLSRTYGDANPILTGSVLGIKNNDVITPIFSTAATSLTGIGTYAIEATATGANISNYELIINNSQLTINKANLTVTVNNFSRTFGEANPSFTASVLGIKNNDVFDLTFTTAASETSNVGSLAILVSVTGANIANYQVALTNGQLSILAALASASVSGVVTNGNVVAITSPVNITINGSGFAQGATVTVNGVALQVVSVTANSIVATLPVGVITSANALNVQVANPNQVASASTSITATDVETSIVNGKFVIAKNEVISIYPNPTSGEFSIACQLSTINYQLLTIYNAQGSVVYSQSIVSGSTVVNTNLQKGIYIVKVGTAVSKLVVD